jgi:cardiolipin synthase
VHVTIDWAGSYNMDETQLKQMQEAGVNVQRYRPLHWYNLGRINNRTHRKLLIIDGQVAFTGGVGIGDPWQGNAQDKDHWRDMHFRVEGPVVAQFQGAFNDNWIKTTGTVLNGADNFPQLERKGDMSAHMFLSSPAGGSESMHLMYLMSIAAAEHSIDLEAAYFIPDALITRALCDARKRNVRIRVVVPGPNTDSDAARHASKSGWGPLLKAGIEISEYQPTMFHNKMMIVDKRVVSVGSTNFDLRSFRLNDEASLNVYDAGFAARMTQVFEEDLAKSKRYTYETWEQRPMKEKFIETFVLPIKSQL